MKLAGIRVLDLSQFMPGPTMTMMMADHGAQVIKIEPPTGDPSRRNSVDDPVTGSDFFETCNRGKRSLALDLKQPAGLEIALRLAARADVMVESFRPGVAQRLGLGYDALRVANPALVYCSMTAFGQDGPLRDLPAHDPVIQAMAGSLPMDDDAAPITDGLPAAAWSGALAALAAVCMALLAAKTTGQGDRIDLALRDCLLPSQPFKLRPAMRSDMANSGLAMNEAYCAADGKWLCLGGRERHFAVNLLTPLGREDLVEIAVGPGGAQQDSLREFLKKTFLCRTRAEWLAWLEQRDVSASPVLDFSEALNHPQTHARQMLQHDAAGLPHLGTPLKFQRTPGKPDLRVPALGEHNAQILAELGYNLEQITTFAQTGVTYKGLR